jgi:sphingosine-1-phosphate phosphatase 1
MPDMIEHLRDPHLVARIQKYYGVEVVSPQNSNPVVTSSNRSVGRSLLPGDVGLDQLKTRLQNKPVTGTSSHYSSSKSKKCVGNGIQSNGWLSVEPEGDETFSSESEPESKGYIITNWGWYYLFVLGTALGDEIFYASFIPFWFWNIDGAVGRRVVLVWTVIMYIGNSYHNVSCLFCVCTCFIWCL